MMKPMMLAAALCAAAVTQVSAMNLSWSVDIVDNTSDYNYQAGLVQLYTAGGTLVNQASNPGGAYPEFGNTIGNADSFHQGAVGTGTYNWTAGQQFYFVVYNATTVGGASEMITTSSFTMPNFPSESDSDAGNTLVGNWATALSGGTGAIATDDARWQATSVPEPASMALFGIGAGVLALRRRFGKKAA